MKSPEKFIELKTDRCENPPKKCYNCGRPIGNFFWISVHPKSWSEEDPKEYCKGCIDIRGYYY